MTLTPTQLYRIKRAKERRAKVILGAISRRYGQDTACNRKIVKFRMNEELHQRFGIRKLEELDESRAEEYLQSVQVFQFEYGGELFG